MPPADGDALRTPSDPPARGPSDAGPETPGSVPGTSVFAGAAAGTYVEVRLLSKAAPAFASSELLELPFPLPFVER